MMCEAGAWARRTPRPPRQRPAKPRRPSGWDPKLMMWTFENESAPRCSNPARGRCHGGEASPRRQIDSPTHLLLRTDYCSPFKSGSIGALPVPAPFLSKWTNGTRCKSQSRPYFCAMVPGLSASIATSAATRPVYGEPHPSQRRGLQLRVGADWRWSPYVSRLPHIGGGYARSSRPHWRGAPRSPRGPNPSGRRRFDAAC